MLDDGDTVFNHVAIRADEEYREGCASKHERLIVRLPLKDAGVDESGVLEILDGAGLGLPAYYEWRTRSGCTFCFFQQKIEWVRLMDRHPDYFKEARSTDVSTRGGGNRPLPNSYWIVPGRFAAGDYPGARRGDEAAARLRTLLQAGVDQFVDLTERHEGLEPYALFVRVV